jgi:N-glycosylase/DNA lyase
MRESVAKVNARGGLPWLESLRAVPHAQARSALLELTGVGMKVADCVCLFALDKSHVVPVDTHVWKLAVDYMPHLADSKSLTPRVYNSVLEHFEDKFGSHAGWAHQILFAAELATFKDRLPEGLRRSSPPTPKAAAKSKKKAEGGYDAGGATGLRGSAGGKVKRENHSDAAAPSTATSPKLKARRLNGGGKAALAEPAAVSPPLENDGPDDGSDSETGSR